MVQMDFVIRTIQPSDRDAWIPLWEGYNAFYQRNIPAYVTDTTWTRLFDHYEPIHGLVATRNDELVGMVHYIFHRNTAMIGPVCYLQDLFTAPSVRGTGVGRALILAVYAAAEVVRSPRVYWLTHETNANAMALYDKVAERSGFIQYRKDLPT
jgi:GNAT superfamily N-acetyltransferase